MSETPTFRPYRPTRCGVSVVVASALVHASPPRLHVMLDAHCHASPPPATQLVKSVDCAEVYAPPDFARCYCIPFLSMTSERAAPQTSFRSRCASSPICRSLSARGMLCMLIYFCEGIEDCQRPMYLQRSRQKSVMLIAKFSSSTTISAPYNASAPRRHRHPPRHGSTSVLYHALRIKSIFWSSRCHNAENQINAYR